MGSGLRFQNAGYQDHKPFIKINGKPMIEYVVKPLLDKYGKVYIACNDETAVIVNNTFDSDLVVPIVLERTDGAGTTMYEAIKLLYNNYKADEDESLMCVDCDTILTNDVLDKIDEGNNYILSFKDSAKTGWYSYLSLDGDIIQRLFEKSAVSETANAGVYVFSKLSIAYDCSKNTELHSIAEKYLSYCVNQSIEDGNVWKHIDISNQFNCVGTPSQLQEYAKNHQSKQIFCFDIDKTLVYDIYNNPKPIKNNVKILNNLFIDGHKIILHTARGMVSYNNDMDAIVENVLPHILSVLKECGIPYHEIHLGKPYADYYVDDKSISIYNNFEKATGVYNGIGNKPRAHHNIECVNDQVIKRGDMVNEEHYYNNIPDTMKHLFQHIVYADVDMIVMKRNRNRTLSEKFTKCQLTTTELYRLLNNLHYIHNIQPEHKIVLTDWGYTEKLIDRYKKHKKFYNQLGIDDIPVNILTRSRYDVYPSIIHGDPVLTNSFVDGTFIDPRGSWDNKQSIYGDNDYDYAKVLQSLLGYDFLLNNIEPPKEYIKNMVGYFLDWYTKTYPERDVYQLQMKTISLYISMIPLHKDDIERCYRFAQYTKSLFEAL
jgi:dTDP-glucose pyrophosphorylase